MQEETSLAFSLLNTRQEAMSETGERVCMFHGCGRVVLSANFTRHFRLAHAKKGESGEVVSRQVILKYANPIGNATCHAKHLVSKRGLSGVDQTKMQGKMKTTTCESATSNSDNANDNEILDGSHGKSGTNMPLIDELGIESGKSADGDFQYEIAQIKRRTADVATVKVVGSFATQQEADKAVLAVYQQNPSQTSDLLKKKKMTLVI